MDKKTAGRIIKIVVGAAIIIAMAVIAHIIRTMNYEDLDFDDYDWE